MGRSRSRRPRRSLPSTWASSGRPSRTWRRLRSAPSSPRLGFISKDAHLDSNRPEHLDCTAPYCDPHLPSSQPWVSSIKSESKGSLCIISNTKSPQYLTTILAMTKIQKNQFPFWYIGDILIGYTWCSNYMDVYRSVMTRFSGTNNKITNIE